MEESSTILITDTESTGVEVDKAGICQIAAIAIQYVNGKYLAPQPLFQTYCKPSEEMEPGAYDVHGIGPEQYYNSPDDMSGVWALTAIAKGLTQPVYYSGYNSTRYDYPLMDKVMPSAMLSEKPQIDVMTLVLRETPEYGLKLTEVFDRITGSRPGMSAWADYQLNSAHDAMADCHMTAYVLMNWIRRYGNLPPSEIAAYCATPQQMAVMPWGKYKGRKMGDVPYSYLTWMAGAWSDMHPDLELTLRKMGAKK